MLRKANWVDFGCSTVHHFHYWGKLMGIATDSYRVNKPAIPPGLVACAMVGVFSLCCKWTLHFSRDIVPGGRQSCIVKARLIGKLRKPI